LSQWELLEMVLALTSYREVQVGSLRAYASGDTMVYRRHLDGRVTANLH
jgi:hypothetical protein